TVILPDPIGVVRLLYRAKSFVRGITVKVGLNLQAHRWMVRVMFRHRRHVELSRAIRRSSPIGSVGQAQCLVVDESPASTPCAAPRPHGQGSQVRWPAYRGERVSVSLRLIDSSMFRSKVDEEFAVRRQAAALAVDAPMQPLPVFKDVFCRIPLDDLNPFGRP